VTLGRMEEKGYVESEPDPNASDDLILPRRIYTPTAYGLRVLEAWDLMRRTLQREGSR
jgi:DNA-binding PadR family transcriptional regulator